MNNKDSLLRNLNKRAGALKKITKSCSFKTRKMIANGIYISKLIYLMPVWVACEGYLESALQVSLNNVARVVTRLDRYTPTTVLMQQCGWMTVKQLKVFHSLVLLQKTLLHQTPSYLYRKVTSGTQRYATRQAAADLTAGVTTQPSVDSSDLDLCRRSWA